MSCFWPNHTKSVANWPGAETQNPLSSHHELYSPDEIEISALSHFMSDPVCQAAVGQIVCQYRRPSVIPLSASATLSSTIGLQLGELSGSPKYSTISAEANITLEAIRGRQCTTSCFSLSSRKPFRNSMKD